MPFTRDASDTSVVDSRSRTVFLARTGLIAAVYAVATFAVTQVMGYLSWGPIQLRISEAITVLPLFFSAAIPGLALGTLIGNILNIGMTGPLGWLDAVFGSLATLLGAIWTFRFREFPARALLGPVIANALIVPAYLPFILRGLGFYTIPFTTFDVSQSFLSMYLFGVVCVGAGQAAVVYGIGMPLATVIRRGLMSFSMKG
jgi:uncharacterized membrane protein